MRNKILAILMLLMPSSAAIAADLNGPQLTDTNPYSWTGIYFGGSIGLGKTEDDDAAFPIAPPVTIQLHSEGQNDNMGLHIGYMQQMGNFVLGAEYEFTNLDIQYVGSGIGPYPVYLENMHMVKGRLGLALGRAQFHAVGGMAYGEISTGLSDWVPTVGFGLDYAVTNNIIIGGEFTHSFFNEFDDQPIEGTLNNYTARISWKF